MNYTLLTVNDKDYKLSLPTKYTIQLEQKIGHSPLKILFDLNNGEIPSVTEIVNILHFMLQRYNHGIKFEDTCDIYDDYLSEDNHTVFTFITEVIVPCYKNSGLLSEDNNEEEDEKN